MTNSPSIATGYEDDEGFQFARVPSKKSKPTSTMELVPENPASDLENTPVQSTPRRGRPPKKRAGESATAATAKRKSTELPTRRPVKGAMSSEPDHREQPEQKKKKPGRPSKSKTADTNGFRSPEPTKVALPVADTPVIQRNKELRGKKSGKGRRRISSEMRGRRASSLIDSGASNGR
jgi:kinetochore protein Mis13/DSN1